MSALQLLGEAEELQKRLADSAEAGESGANLMLEDSKLASPNTAERVGRLHSQKRLKFWSSANLFQPSAMKLSRFEPFNNIVCG